MTSAVTREDVQAELYRAGIRSSFVTARLMAAIDAYVRTQLRQVRPLEDVPVPPDPEFADLLPGESDPDAMVARCKQCAVVKKWHLFSGDSSSPSGLKAVCKNCTRGPHHVIAYEDRRWFCPGCSDTSPKKPPSAFPQEKRDNPRVKAKCLACTEKASGEEKAPAG